MGWIRIRMDPELLPGYGSGTQKIQSWIRKKSFRIQYSGSTTLLFWVESSVVDPDPHGPEL